MKKLKTICFQTSGGVNHDFGGLDRVTELLADYFEENGYKVFYLSQINRPNTKNSRQYYLPNENNLTAKENIEFYNKFIEQKEIDILINQEGNVNIILPLSNSIKSIIYITALHFNPNYITNFHFINKFNKMNIPYLAKNILLNILKIPFIETNAFAYLHRKLENNYYINCLNCDRFVLLSNHFKKDFESLFKTKKTPTNITAINNPIKLNNTTVDFTKKKKQLLYVGRLECNMKRIDKLLNNWSKIAVDFTDWTLHLVGAGPDELQLKQQVKKQNIPRVFFEGVQNPQKYYEESSIFCFSSDSSEGWGMVLVEAQMYGCVPIAFNSYSAISEIINDGKSGRLITAFNDIEYIKALIELMQNENLRINMAKNAIESVKKFDINTIGKQWITLFEDTIKNRNFDTK